MNENLIDHNINDTYTVNSPIQEEDLMIAGHFVVMYDVARVHRIILV